MGARKEEDEAEEELNKTHRCHFSSRARQVDLVADHDCIVPHQLIELHAASEIGEDGGVDGIVLEPRENEAGGLVPGVNCLCEALHSDIPHHARHLLCQMVQGPRQVRRVLGRDLGGWDLGQDRGRDLGQDLGRRWGELGRRWGELGRRWGDLRRVRWHV